MVIESRFSAPIPSCSIQKWIFGSASGPLPCTPAWIDVYRPATHYLTFPEARLLAKRIAVGLIDEGLKPGERVLIFSGNNIIFPAVVLGIWMAGGIFTGVNPSSVARELYFQLEDSGASLMIVEKRALEVALEAADQMGMAHHKVFLLDGDLPDGNHPVRQDSHGARHWTDLVATRDRGNEFEWTEPADPKNTTCVLNYSSGTVSQLLLSKTASDIASRPVYQRVLR